MHHFLATKLLLTHIIVTSVQDLGRFVRKVRKFFSHATLPSHAAFIVLYLWNRDQSSLAQTELISLIANYIISYRTKDQVIFHPIVSDSYVVEMFRNPRYRYPRKYMNITSNVYHSTFGFVV